LPYPEVVVYNLHHPGEAVEMGIVQVVTAVGHMRIAERIHPDAVVTHVIEEMGSVDPLDTPGVGLAGPSFIGLVWRRSYCRGCHQAARDCQSKEHQGPAFETQVWPDSCKDRLIDGPYALIGHCDSPLQNIQSIA